jgi:hypothetical protein
MSGRAYTGLLVLAVVLTQSPPAFAAGRLAKLGKIFGIVTGVTPVRRLVKGDPLDRALRASQHAQLVRLADGTAVSILRFQGDTGEEVIGESAEIGQDLGLFVTSARTQAAIHINGPLADALQLAANRFEQQRLPGPEIRMLLMPVGDGTPEHKGRRTYNTARGHLLFESQKKKHEQIISLKVFSANFLRLNVGPLTLPRYYR